MGPQPRLGHRQPALVRPQDVIRIDLEGNLVEGDWPVPLPAELVALPDALGRVAADGDAFRWVAAFWDY